MNDSNLAVIKLQIIQGLWRELGRTESTSAEYEIRLKKIRVLSAEYQLLVDAASIPQNSRIAPTL
jgi:hypothetical protein